MQQAAWAWTLPLCLLAMRCALAASEPGAFASAGKLPPPFVGSLAVQGALREALDACSFRNELILVSSTRDSLGAVAQVVAMLGRFGLAHVLLVATGSDTCDLARGALPGVCCTWDTVEPMPPANPLSERVFGGSRRLMHIRHRVLARILRFGTNLLFLDTDIILFEDPYRVFKSPPFSEANLLASGDVMEVNTGMLYVQNVSPDGPVAWAFAEVVDRLLRWAEQPDFLMAKANPHVATNLLHVTWEQAVFGDCLLSTAVGRPLFASAWAYQLGGFNEEWMARHTALLGEAKCSKTWTGQPSLHLAALARSSDIAVELVRLFRPFTSGTWPDEHGGRGVPEARGASSRAWQAVLSRESGAPMWPDPDAPECHAEPQLPRPHPPEACNGAGGDIHGHGGVGGGGTGGCTGRGRTEALALLPPWVYNTWSRTVAPRRELRYDWDVQLSPPTQLFGHALYMPAAKRVYKRALQQAYGWYNWSVAEAVHRAGAADLYLAHPREDVSGAPPGRVRALAASDALAEQLAALPVAQLTVALRTLMLAALGAGRAIGWPALPCAHVQRVVAELDAMLAGKRPDPRRSVEGYYTAYAVPYPAARRPGLCIWSDMLQAGCVDQGVGLLPPELDHLAGSHSRGAGQQGGGAGGQLPGITLQLPPAPPRGAVPPSMPRGISAGAAHLYRHTTLQQLREVAAAHADAPVVLVDAVPLVGDLRNDTHVRMLAHGALHGCWAAMVPSHHAGAVARRRLRS